MDMILLKRKAGNTLKRLESGQQQHRDMDKTAPIICRYAEQNPEHRPSMGAIYHLGQCPMKAIGGTGDKMHTSDVPSSERNSKLFSLVAL